MQIHIRHPDREGGILLEEALSGIQLVAQMTADAAANEEERKAEHEAEHGNGQQQRQRGLAVYDVSHSNT